MSILGDATYRGFGDDFQEADHLAKSLLQRRVW
jgi:hypothetical protein